MTNPNGNIKNFNLGARRKTNAAKKRKAKDIPFTLETNGPVYHYRGEVSADSIAMVSALFMSAEERQNPAEMATLLLDMFDLLFTPETGAALMKRIKSPDDYLTFDLLTPVIEGGTELHTGGRPTTSPRT